MTVAVVLRSNSATYYCDHFDICHVSSKFGAVDRARHRIHLSSKQIGEQIYVMVAVGVIQLCHIHRKHICW